MGERMAEQELLRIDIKDKMEILHKGCTSKIRCLTEAMGNEHLYDVPLS